VGAVIVFVGALAAFAIPRTRRATIELHAAPAALGEGELAPAYVTVEG